MSTRARVFAGSLLLALAVSGCPVTDDYYLLTDEVSSSGKGGSDAGAGTSAGGTGGSFSVIPGGSSQGAASQGGSAQGGTDQGGSSTGAQPTGGSDSAGTSSGGEASGAGAPSEGGAGGVPPDECSPTTERCNGHDDDCDGGVDEFGVCPNGCSGFVVDAELQVGYMYCTTLRDFSHAAESCADQNMRLAWLDSSEENAGVSETLAAIGDDTEVLIGATDQAREGDWFWSGGVQFWKGNQNGFAVGGEFSAWSQGTPDSFGGNEDCASINPNTQRWSDRSCNVNFSYLCEDLPAPAP